MGLETGALKMPNCNKGSCKESDNSSTKLSHLQNQAALYDFKFLNGRNLHNTNETKSTSAWPGIYYQSLIFLNSWCWNESLLYYYCTSTLVSKTDKFTSHISEKFFYSLLAINILPPI